METLIAEDSDVGRVIEATQHTYLDKFGMTGRQYEMVLLILIRGWYYGEAVRQWNNARNGEPGKEGFVTRTTLVVGNRMSAFNS